MTLFPQFKSQYPPASAMMLDGMAEPFDPSRIAGPRRVGQRESLSLPPGPLTVSQVSALVKRAIETILPATLHVVGQISNAKRHSSGHFYFTLKDSSSELACVMWRSDAAKLKFKPIDGLEVVASGSVEVFERAGRYQLYVRKLEPRGVGALELAFRQLCEKLREEGLFDPARKKPLPRFPRRVAIVTSPTGAAVADMLRTIRRKFPCVEVLIHPVRVQGEGAAGEIAAAIARLNEYGDRHHRQDAGATPSYGIDVMIVGRGGGSIEDLWAFNEEIVARAVSASRIPIISGVGHETDLTVCDLVADARAATPTAAAELAVPDLNEVLVGIDAQALRIRLAAVGLCSLAAAGLKGLLHRRPFREPLTAVRHRSQAVDEAAHRLHRQLAHRLTTTRRRLDALESGLQRIAPHAYLLRTGARLRDIDSRLRRIIDRRLAGADRQLATFMDRLVRRPSIARLSWAKLRMERIADRMPGVIGQRLRTDKARLNALGTLLSAVSHERVLARGFSITRIRKGRRLVRSVEDITNRDRIVTQLADGEIESDVVSGRGPKKPGSVGRQQLDLFE